MITNNTVYVKEAKEELDTEIPALGKTIEAEEKAAQLNTAEDGFLDKDEHDKKMSEWLHDSAVIVACRFYV